jgi:hypothetical protein
MDHSFYMPDNAMIRYKTPVTLFNSDQDYGSPSFNSQLVSSSCYQMPNQYIYQNYELANLTSDPNSSQIQATQFVTTRSNGMPTNSQIHAKQLDIYDTALTSGKHNVTAVSMKHLKRSKFQQLPEKAVTILNIWFEEHIAHPYPTAEEKQKLSEQCGIKCKQLNSWFCNRRNRSQNTKPKRIKKKMDQEISKALDELRADASNMQVIEKFRKIFKIHKVLALDQE